MMTSSSNGSPVDESGSSVRTSLRLITYLVPGLPLSLYQTYQHYLEEALGVETTLMVESRWNGPPKGRTDPLDANLVDIGFVSSTSLLQHQSDPRSHMALLPVAPIHMHPKSELRPIYYSDVIISTDKKGKYKDFHDLKGCRWAYSHDESLSGYIATLAELKKQGVDSNFFGHIMKSGSHLNSLDYVLHGRADACAVDSSVYYQWIRDHPEYKDKLINLCSWGPLPVQPVVVNKRMSDEMKQKICTALLDMNKSVKWNQVLQDQHVWGFKAIEPSLYNMEEEIKSMVGGQSMNSVYY